MISQVSRKQSISAALPSTSEELHLKTHNSFEASLNIGETADFAELVTRLHEIAIMSKYACFPALAKVAFGIPKSHPKSRSSYALYEAVGSSVLGGLVKEAYEKADIQLLCHGGISGIWVLAAGIALAMTKTLISYRLFYQ